jgi:sulfoxide reductase catalytic subunit YedY
MLIRIARKSDPFPSDITSESAYLRRREFLAGCTSAALMAMAGESTAGRFPRAEMLEQRLSNVLPSTYGRGEVSTPLEHITRYNNFYEFGVEKTNPAEYAHEMKTDPWSVEVAGHAEMTGVFALEDLLSWVDLEERIYRLRCVEAWSMVIPWVGFSLSALIRKLAPMSRARYVFFETLYAPDQMRGQRSPFSSIKWPYVEGLRLDEAMHSLSFMAIGLYGRVLPNQNGAPIRLVVPWKYGFKSIKSIVKIHFVEQRLKTSWELAGPNEYGFYSNVNPDVDHPRWSQREERRLPSSFFSPNRIPTLIFNGYPEVAGLYAGMDLKKNF